MDAYMAAAIAEAEAGLARGEFPSAPFSFTRARSSAGDTTGAVQRGISILHGEMGWA